MVLASQFLLSTQFFVPVFVLALAALQCGLGHRDSGDELLVVDVRPHHFQKSNALDQDSDFDNDLREKGAGIHGASKAQDRAVKASDLNLENPFVEQATGIHDAAMAREGAAMSSSLNNEVGEGGSELHGTRRSQDGAEKMQANSSDAESLAQTKAEAGPVLEIAKDAFPFKLNQEVVVMGLQKQKELNGHVGVCTQIKEIKEKQNRLMCWVKFADGRFIWVAPENMSDPGLARNAINRWKKVAHDSKKKFPFKLYQKVVVTGLVNQSIVNGLTGTCTQIQRMAENQNGFMCRLTFDFKALGCKGVNEGQFIWVAPENLRDAAAKVENTGPCKGISIWVEGRMTEWCTTNVKEKQGIPQRDTILKGAQNMCEQINGCTWSWESNKCLNIEASSFPGRNGQLMSDNI